MLGAADEECCFSLAPQGTWIWGFWHLPRGWAQLPEDRVWLLRTAPPYLLSVCGWLRLTVQASSAWSPTQQQGRSLPEEEEAMMTGYQVLP